MIVRWILDLAERRVPDIRRAAWRAEWDAELWELRTREPNPARRFRRSLRFALGARAHALAESRRHANHTTSRTRSMQTLVLDIRYALRSFRRTPTFTIVAIITLALGIGATTTIFSVVDGVLLRPLPYGEPDRLVMVGSTSQRLPGLAPVNPMDYFDWRSTSTTLSHLVAQDSYTFDLVDGERPERVEGAAVAAGFFDLLGVQPLLGRGIRPEDDQPTVEPVVVLSYGLWQRRFGGDSNVLGRSVSTADHQFTVVGVMPQGFRHPEAFWANGVEMWMPLSFIDNPLDSRGARYLQVIGRLAPGVSIDQSRQEMDGIARALEERYTQNQGRMTLIEPLRDETIGGVAEALTMLMGSVGLLLLIACVNVANLFLARATDRRREMSLRSALGAARTRIYQQVLTEGVLLSLFGGALGVGLAFLAVQAFRAVNPGNVPRADEVAVDGRVLLFTVVVSVVTGVLFALVPAWRVSRHDDGASLRTGSQHGTTGVERHRFRQSLVALELALAVVLVVGAGLFINSFTRLRAVDPGFDPRNTVTAALALNTGYDATDSQIEFYRQLSERLETIPEAVSVAYASSLPLDGNRFITGLRIEGRESDPGNPDVADYSQVSPGFFAVMDIVIIDGREFTALDDSGHESVLLVNEAFARQYWPGERAVGKRVARGRSDQWSTVVGVARDINRQGLSQPAEPEMFFPILQRVSPFVQFAVRTTGNVTRTADAIRDYVAELDNRLPVTISTMEESIASSITQPRFYTLLLSSFAGVALVLAAVGVYGTMSYTVGQRQQELGIRMALGATGGNVLGMVVREGLLLTGLGVVVGLAGATAASQVMESFLFGVSARDSITYAAAAGSLGLVAVLACYIPARRASRGDPVAALRG